MKNIIYLEFLDFDTKDFIKVPFIRIKDSNIYYGYNVLIEYDENNPDDFDIIVDGCHIAKYDEILNKNSDN